MERHTSTQIICFNLIFKGYSYVSIYNGGRDGGGDQDPKNIWFKPIIMQLKDVRVSCGCLQHKYLIKQAPSAVVAHSNLLCTIEMLGSLN